MLGNANAIRVEVFYIANARLYGQRDVSHRRVQANFFDLADEAEQRLHLVTGRLRSDVGHLNYFRSHDDGDDGFRGASHLHLEVITKTNVCVTEHSKM